MEFDLNQSDDALKKASSEGKLKVLVVEDDDSNRSALERLLVDEGYEVALAKGGNQALEMLQDEELRDKLDIIMTDQRMPGLNGVEFLKKTISLFQTRERRVIRILMTAFTENKVLMQAINEASISKFIMKPYEPEFLLWELKGAVDAHQTEMECYRLLIKEREEIQKKENRARVFEQFVPKPFLDRIAQNGIENILVGEKYKENLTILFSDIRKYTDLTEKLSLEELSDFLNRYFPRMNKPIYSYSGFIDKFMGDAIMALFDRQEEKVEVHALDAVQAAIEMQKALSRFNQEYSAVYSEIEIGVGIHTGEVLLGTVGCDDRMDSTVVGDPVNLSSRLEGLSKIYQAPILISQETLQAMIQPKGLHCRELDWIRVKGRKEDVMIYEIYESDSAKKQVDKSLSAPSIQAGIQARKNGKFAEAKQAYLKAQELYSKDPTPQLFLDEMQERETEGTLDEWDGILSFVNK